MSYYTSIAIIGLGAVMFLAYNGWRFIGTDSEKSGFNQAIGLFFLLMGFVLLIALFNVAIQIGETEVGIAQDVTDAISFEYWAFIIAGIVFLLWVLLVLFFAPVQAAMKRRQLKYE